MRSAIVLIALLLGLAGCGQRAKIERRDGARFEGVIVGGDSRELVLDPISESRRRLPAPQQMLHVPLDDIADIDHPGDAERALGVALVTIGGLEYGLAGAFTALSYAGEYAEGPTPESVLAFAVPALLTVGIGSALYLVGAQSNADSRGAMHDPRAGAYGRGELSRADASTPRLDAVARARARRERSITVTAAFRAIVLGVGDNGEPGGALAVGLPLYGPLRLETGAELDSRPNGRSPTLCLRVPLRLDIGLPLGGSAYAMSVQPEVSYVLVAAEAGLEPARDVRHAVGFAFGLAHRFAVSRRVEIELAHGLHVISVPDPDTADPGGNSEVRLAYDLVDALFVRLGVRVAL